MIFENIFSQTMYVKSISKANLWTTFLRPFNIFTWLAVAATSLVCSLVYGFALHFCKERDKDKEFYRNKISLAVLLPLYGLICHGNPNEPSDISKRIIFFITFLFGFVIVASYSACLTSFLAVRVNHLPFHDPTSLLYRSNYKVVSVGGSYVGEFFKVRHQITIKFAQKLPSPFAAW